MVERRAPIDRTSGRGRAPAGPSPLALASGGVAVPAVSAWRFVCQRAGEID
jgi:hypothetical protein